MSTHQHEVVEVPVVRAHSSLMCWAEIILLGFQPDAHTAHLFERFVSHITAYTTALLSTRMENSAKILSSSHHVELGGFGKCARVG